MIIFLTKEPDGRSCTFWGETDNRDGFYKLYDFFMSSTRPEDFLIYDTDSGAVTRMVDYEDDR